MSALYPEFSSNYPLLLTTFMKRPVNLYPNHEAIVYRNPDTGEYFRFTWRQWYERTCRLANAFISTLGIDPGKPKAPGDRVATMALNHHRHLELYYAVPCSGAEMVPAVLLENITATADFVLEATYVGVPDSIWGQRPMALVTLTPDSDKGVKDVMNWLHEEGVAKGKITKWMLPDYVVITNDIPKTSVGKFDKKVIRAEMDRFLEKAVKVGK